MTQPDRRHLRRARLARCRRGRRRSGRLAVVPWRAYLSAAESDGVSLPGILSRSEGISPPGAAGRAGLICADDPPGDRRSAAGFPDCGERRPVRRFWGGALSWFSAMAGAGLLLLHRQSAGARSGGETHRPRGAAQCRRLFSPALARRRSWSAACCRLSRLTRSAMPPD